MILIIYLSPISAVSPKVSKQFQTFKILQISSSRLYYYIITSDINSFILSLLSISIYLSFIPIIILIELSYSSNINISHHITLILYYHLYQYIIIEFYYTNLSSSLFSLYHYSIYLLYP
jgi:hypothetical protein